MIETHENFSQMNNRLSDLPTQTDFDSYMGKVNTLEGTLNNHIEAALQSRKKSRRCKTG